MNASSKPIAAKNYGSIGHLPGSRVGPGDHTINGGQAKYLLEKTRDKYDTVYVHEKVDGSNVGVLRQGEALIALSRSGRQCSESTLEQHQMFARWVRENDELFHFLNDGERLCGEWMAQAHGIRYKLPHGPFIGFDLMRGIERASAAEVADRVPSGIPWVKCLHVGGAIAIDAVMALLGERGHHGAQEHAEGVVYRMERKGKVDWLGKYVRASHVPGKYFAINPGEVDVWNWRFESNKARMEEER